MNLFRSIIWIFIWIFIFIYLFEFFRSFIWIFIWIFIFIFEYLFLFLNIYFYLFIWIFSQLYLNFYLIIYLYFWIFNFIYLNFYLIIYLYFWIFNFIYLNFFAALFEFLFLNIFIYLFVFFRSFIHAMYLAPLNSVMIALPDRKNFIICLLLFYYLISNNFIICLLLRHFDGTFPRSDKAFAQLFLLPCSYNEVVQSHKMSFEPKYVHSIDKKLYLKTKIRSGFTVEGSTEKTRMSTTQNLNSQYFL